MSLLRLENISLKFAETTALSNINYEIQNGDFIILLGSNGSGKSTLLKLLYRMYQPASGNISFLGISLHTHRAKSFSRQVAVLTQNCNETLFPSMTVYENYLIARDSQPTNRDYFKNYLQDYNKNLSDKLDLPVNKLSGGEKQVLALALCLLKPPALLLLDEHTSALDPKTSNEIMQLTKKMISKYNISCVLTTHDLDIALNYGNRILMLEQGKIKRTINFEEKQLLNRSILLQQYF